MAIQINVEYENGGFLSPLFLYCSALSKPEMKINKSKLPKNSIQFIVIDNTHSFGNGFCAEVFLGSDLLNAWVN